MRVLVTDAEFKNSLSVIRNLGRHGYHDLALLPRRRHSRVPPLLRLGAGPP